MLDLALARMARLVLGFVWLGLCFGCASQPRVFTDFDSSQDFSSYSTFSWMSADPVTITGDQPLSPLASKRLLDDVKAALEAKGFAYTSDKQMAQFLISMTLGARDQLEIRDVEVVDYYGPHWGWGYNYYDFAYHPGGFSHTETMTREYEEGTLSIDVFDVANKSPVWHASATKRLTSSEMSGQSGETIKAGVDLLLQNFPPSNAGDN